jgi:hypothetical protein
MYGKVKLAYVAMDDAVCEGIVAVAARTKNIAIENCQYKYLNGR